MARKVFISFLGGTNYKYCDYWKDDISYGNVRFIQEATLNYLDVNNKWTPNDVAMILLTKGAEESNWVDNGQKDKQGNLVCDELTKGDLKGLESCLKKFNIFLNPVKGLPDGNNENEIWTIFERVFAEIKDYDELYFDITHGFRYLPMLALVLCNYSTFLKNVAVKSITYGNFEVAREIGHGMIVDLLPLSQLQDWTYAAGQYLDSGNVERLVRLCAQEFQPILSVSKGENEAARNLRNFVKKLSDVTKERMTCRGMDIIKSRSFKGLKETSEKVETSFIRPFKPIFDKIQTSFKPFDEEENISNGFSAAKWCFDNGLYQQSATILQEIVVSYVCQRHNIQIDDETQRGIVNKAFNISFNKTDEKDWDIEENKKEKLKEVLLDKIFKNDEMVNAFNDITIVRNDYNHSGMRSGRLPMKPDKIIINIEKCIHTFECLFCSIDSSFEKRLPC